MPKISEAQYRERREHIMETARRSFAKEGIGISVDGVCEMAGISKGAFYGYFKSKNALLEALASDHGARIMALPAPDNAAALTAMLLERSTVTEPAIARVELDTLAYATGHPALSTIVVENMSSLHKAIRSAIDAQPVPPPQPAIVAQLLGLMTLGASLTIALRGPSAVNDVREGIEGAVRLLLDDGDSCAVARDAGRKPRSRTP